MQRMCDSFRGSKHHIASSTRRAGVAQRQIRLERLDRRRRARTLARVSIMDDANNPAFAKGGMRRCAASPAYLATRPSASGDRPKRETLERSQAHYLRDELPVSATAPCHCRMQLW